MAQKRQGVYIITNTKNGKRYIGSSSNIDLRLPQHFEQLRQGKHNHKMMHEYRMGADFQTEVIEYPDLDRNQLYDKEQKYINERQPELNVSPFAKPHNYEKWRRKKRDKELPKKLRKKRKMLRKKEARERRKENCLWKKP